MRLMTEPDSLELSAPLRGLDSERIVAIISASNTHPPSLQYPVS